MTPRSQTQLNSIAARGINVACTLISHEFRHMAFSESLHTRSILLQGKCLNVIDASRVETGLKWTIMRGYVLWQKSRVLFTRINNSIGNAPLIGLVIKHSKKKIPRNSTYGAQREKHSWQSAQLIASSRTYIHRLSAPLCKTHGSYKSSSIPAKYQAYSNKL